MISIGQFGNGIRRYFNTNPDKFLWREGLILSGRITIDILYLDEWLSQQKGYNPDDSIQNNLKHLYGEDAAKWVESVML